MFHLKPVFPYWFLLDDVHWYKGVKIPITIVLLSISCFMSVDISCVCLGAFMFGAYMFTITISSSWIDPLVTL